MTPGDGTLANRLQDSAIAMRNVAREIEQLSVLIVRDDNGVLHGTLDKEQCVARLLSEADQNMALVKAKAAEKEGTDGCLEG